MKTTNSCYSIRIALDNFSPYDPSYPGPWDADEDHPGYCEYCNSENEWVIEHEDATGVTHSWAACSNRDCPGEHQQCQVCGTRITYGSCATPDCCNCPEGEPTPVPLRRVA